MIIIKDLYNNNNNNNNNNESNDGYDTYIEAVEKLKFNVSDAPTNTQIPQLVSVPLSTDYSKIYAVPSV